MDKARSLPRGRLARLAHLGWLVGSVGLNTVAAGAREIGRGRRQGLSQLLASADNLNQVAGRLAQMRGAAMKLGQLLSMDAGDLLPAELAEILAQLREKADALPADQLEPVLKEAWGEGWRRRFRYFSPRPLAAASIGQVHEAETLDGRRLAVKVQYPGIRESIDSDLDNVAALLRLIRLVPDEVELAPLLEVARRQLHEEADYSAESGHLAAMAQLLEGDGRFQVPSVDPALSTDRVLAMSYLDGVPIERLVGRTSGEREAVAVALVELALREVLAWGVVQTDPNFANYRYCPQSGRLQLLDFGAVRRFPAERRHALRRLLQAGMDNDGARLYQAALAIGYLGESDPAFYQETICGLLHDAFQPFRVPSYDFGASALARRMSERVLALRLERRYTRMPPPDVLFLHRKVGGLYMLLRRLRVSVAVRDICQRFLATLQP
ncbi:AarF/ABC1/UbiB kinase family protein [Motiliproteus sp. SC1-56]|uniref:ABC1 kinase family protein n=1 Tax=Motiliproteus sp. SC1-56 TaxID=2799565 RepID=UPI001A8E8B9B|nr:AarF/ABC1/UbiB kinase family protein [Motiliproteus sp. SC1-56]